MNTLIVKIWKNLNGTIQWYILWFFHCKMNVCVSGVVFNDQGEVLLLRHRYWKEGSWGLPSGFAIRREEVSTTLVREVKEETNLDIEVTRFLRFDSGYQMRVEVSMVAQLRGGELQIDPHEILEARFFPPESLPKGLVSKHREIVELTLTTQGCAQLDHLTRGRSKHCSPACRQSA
ncbi:MAG: NUDIX domain-containing protein [Candidatus Electrothrix sp. ATG1]|nr:NUDIX domain-containing protein [Candidatus Electrothrix sp. ATG1]